MRQTPILFSAPMVRALIAGSKGQTRRLLDGWTDEPPAFVEGGAITAFDARERPYRWPRTHAIGDELYVREAWRVAQQYDGFAPVYSASGKPVLPARGMTVLFEAGGSIANQANGRWEPDNSYPPERPEWAGKVRQGMHMPRWASRITLAVTDVRVQRLQDIDRDDAKAEGIPEFWHDAVKIGLPRAAEDHGHVWDNHTSVENYRMLWEAINGPDSWAANPWVAAYTFTLELGNIDQIARAA